MNRQKKTDSSTDLFYQSACMVIKSLVCKGFQALFAGGWVRDYLLHIPSQDIDVATNAPPDAVQKIFPRTIPVGKSFGIIIVQIRNVQIEVATFRREGSYTDGRHPNQAEIAWTSAREDAQRRDFTINGLFYDPLQKEIIDYVGGQNDLKKRIVRTIGNAEKRFEEDRLRMIRAIRFLYRDIDSSSPFTLEKRTEEAILKQADSLLPAVSIERVWQEFQKMSRGKRFAEALVKMDSLTLLSHIFASFSLYCSEELQERILSSFSLFPHDTPTILYLIQILRSNSLQKRMDFCDYLKVSHREKQWVKQYHVIESLEREGEKNKLEKWITLYAEEGAQISLSIYCSTLTSEEEREKKWKEHDDRQKKYREQILRKKYRNPLLTSYHLREKGILPGKKMGQLLREGERLATIHQYTEPEQVIYHLQQKNLL